MDYCRKMKMVEEQIYKLQGIIAGKNRQMTQAYTFLDQKLAMLSRSSVSQTNVT